VDDTLHRQWREVGKVTIEIVWEPSWSPDRMSPTARAALGITES
jgi:metal-sulfur cluster biosynthetic enzyme